MGMWTISSQEGNYGNGAQQWIIALVVISINSLYVLYLVGASLQYQVIDIFIKLSGSLCKKAMGNKQPQAQQELAAGSATKTTLPPLFASAAHESIKLTHSKTHKVSLFAKNGGVYVTPAKPLTGHTTSIGPVGDDGSKM
jgi:hypothetical protein